MVGYGTITPVPPLVAASVPPSSEERAFHHRVRDLMVDNGFTEVSNYSFISDDLARKFDLDPTALLRVANPIAEGQNLMRSSLIPGVWRNVVENAKHFEEFRQFEIGREIHPSSEELPDEIPHVVAAYYRKSGDGAEGLFELKRVAECALPGITVSLTAPRSFEHSARAALISFEGKEIGRLFEFHPSFVESGRSAVLDLDLRALKASVKPIKRYTPIRRYPTSAFDLSILTPLRTPVGELQSKLSTLAGDGLVGIEFLREDSGAPLPADMKSVSFRLTLGASDRTLSSEEASAVRQSVIDGMRSQGFELRV
jgi:phenylalanyl-tRNA synthetase beta chain